MVESNRSSFHKRGIVPIKVCGETVLRELVGDNAARPGGLDLDSIIIGFGVMHGDTVEEPARLGLRALDCKRTRKKRRYPGQVISRASPFKKAWPLSFLR
jgi:hypothetical protein